ncbi:OLC1v1036380C1 [Oldenlandia corymbosa var. corymbosa]|uniref:OLC1v1036380C1 n=1 Tax=Oldenlandia corymbosa var. corymbosa TaxID=529605 RepID=A0AAV1CX43_OLDCO|nr:OLC1v1036380C1 [Oldenlandia corymbosa var. corymbosa]
MLKWTLGFKYEEDPPIVLIWVSLYDLSVKYLNPEVIFSIATAIGKPLKVDAPTLNMTRPSVARFCVEADLMKELPKLIRIGKKGRKHEQYFTYEHIPSYCSKCSKIGHKREDCKKGLALQTFPVVKANDSGKRSETGGTGKSLVIKPQKVKWKPQEGVKIMERADNVVSTSGITTTEKSLIPIDVQKEAATEMVIPAAAVSDEACKDKEETELVVETHRAVIEDSGTDHEQKQCTVNPNVLSLLIVMKALLPSNKNSALSRLKLMRLCNQIEKGMQNIPVDPIEKLLIQDDAQVDNRREEDSDDEAIAGTGRWSEGEIADALVEQSEQGELTIKVLEDNEYVLHMEIHNPSILDTFFVSAVYAKSTRQARQLLWSNLMSFKQRYGDVPRMVAGDFNVIRSLEEYSGSSLQDHTAIEEFNDSIANCELLEFPSVKSLHGEAQGRQVGLVRS